MPQFLSNSFDRLGNDESLANDSPIVDETLWKGNNLDVNRVLESLRDDIKSDEGIAIKSAILLKMLEVIQLSSLTGNNHVLIEFSEF